MNLVYKIDIFFIIGIVIFSGLLYATVQSTNVVRESSNLVSTTQETLYNLEIIESSIIEIEAGNRGYIITGNDDFLISHPLIESNVQKALEKVKSIHSPLTNNDYLEVLANLIERKIELGRQGSNLRRSTSIDSALLFVTSGQGKLVMDSIQMVISTIEAEELENLNSRTNQNEEFIFKRNRVFLVLTGFILIAVTILHVHIRQTTKKLIAYQSKQHNLIKVLNHQNRQLDDFAHIISHNIRSPAQNIYTLISLLKKDSSLEDFKFIYEKLSKVSQNLNETLNELIEVLHIKKKEGVENEELYFKDILEKVLQSMQGEIIVSKAEITYDFHKAETIEYPKTYLESIIYNLLSNAIKYRAKDRTPQIHFETFYKEGDIILKASDNGLGIDLKKYGNQVFGLRKVFHENENAKGVGLFMTKTQIEALDGEITVESEVNKGTTFTVIFGRYKS